MRSQRSLAPGGRGPIEPGCADVDAAAEGARQQAPAGEEARARRGWGSPSGCSCSRSRSGSAAAAAWR
jgi:hypothetical protein